MLQVGELAKRAGVSARAVRHYDRADLLPSSRRSNGYRDFTGEAVERVAQIRVLLGLGLNLAEVAMLLACFTDTGKLGGCVELRTAVDNQVKQVEAQILALTGARNRLTSVASTWDEPSQPHLACNQQFA